MFRDEKKGFTSRGKKMEEEKREEEKRRAKESTVKTSPLYARGDEQIRERNTGK